MVITLIVAFVLSGAAGLIYESIWSRYLGLFLGHSAYAQAVVLIIFLGGMSLGALATSRWSARLRDPLFAYAVIEALAGVLGLGFHSVFVAATEASYDVLFPALAGTVWLGVVKWSLASLLILPQSILLGATFPLMSAGLLRRGSQSPGRTLALLYFANSLGAAAGVLVSGFVLIGVAGLPGTVTAAAIVNLVVAMVVIVALRLDVKRSSVDRPAPLAVAMPSTPPAWLTVSPRLLWRLLLLVSFGTAVSSFFYEIAWIRMLSLVLGSATHSFELMLSAFILGLALGAFWVRSRADRFTDPIRTLGLVQWAMGLLAIGTLPLYLGSFDWTAHLLSTFGRTDAGYQAFNLARYGLCLLVMLPATFCAGVTLPLITRALLVAGGGERAIGMVYGVNTLGSIVGAALAALVLLPWLGLKNLLVTGAVLDVALGLMLVVVTSQTHGGKQGLPTHGGKQWLPTVGAQGRRWVPLAGVAALVVVTIVSTATFDRVVLTSGVYRTGTLPDRGSMEMLFYRDGRTATVSVRRHLDDGHLTLSTNGKPDASLGLDWLRPPSSGPLTPMDGDYSCQVLLPLITLAHAPRAADAAVIGQGSGMTSHMLLGSPRLRRLVTIEIEPEIIEASKAFLPANRRVFEDPRSTFAIDDAKSYFAAAQRRFDLILSEPSNPWVSGVSGLFTTEFYRRVRGHLSDQGVFGQWLHLYEINDDLILSVVAALHRNFESYEIYMVGGSDLLIVASNRRGALVPDWSVVDDPGIASDLRRVLRLTPETLAAMWVANRTVLGPLMKTVVRSNSDFFPVLDLGAERARYLTEMARGFALLNADRFSMAPALAGRRAEAGRQAVVATPWIPRVRSMALTARLREYDRPPTGMAQRPLIRRANDPDLGSGRNATVDGAGLLPQDWEVRAAHHRRRLLEAQMSSRLAPGDWPLWVQSALQVEQDLHGGAAGTADASFYGRLTDYLEAARAPTEAREAVGFLQSLASWDFAGVARHAEPLTAAALRHEDWLPNELLLDGSVTAYLMLGDAKAARRSFSLLARRVSRRPDDLRIRLLGVHVMASSWNRLAGSELPGASPGPKLGASLTR